MVVVADLVPMVNVRHKRRLGPARLLGARRSNSNFHGHKRVLRRGRSLGAGERRFLPGVDGGVSIRYASNEMFVASIGNFAELLSLELGGELCVLLGRNSF